MNYYQDYLKDNGIPILYDRLNKTLTTIVEHQNDEFQKKLSEHLKAKKMNAAELETLEELGIRVDE
jgi:hypothetical protein